MSKEKKSKLDAFTERLDDWFGVDKKTIAEVQAQLKLDGVSVSSGRLSQWWAERQRQKMQAALLNQISTGAQQCKSVEKMFGKNPAPELDTLIKLHRVLILKLSTEGNVSPEMLELVSGLMKPVLEFAKLNMKEREFALDERRVKLLEKKAASFDKAKEVVDSALSPEQQRLALKEILK